VAVRGVSEPLWGKGASFAIWSGRHRCGLSLAKPGQRRVFPSYAAVAMQLEPRANAWRSPNSANFRGAESSLLCPMLILLKNLPSIRNLEGRCLQRLEASETPLGAASDSPPFAIRPKQVFQGSPMLDTPVPLPHYQIPRPSLYCTFEVRFRFRTGGPIESLCSATRSTA
jgi:hypothetical protein